MAENKKITYKEMKLMQRNDLRSKRITNTIHRNFSTLIAYIFVKIGVSPNTITISSFFLCIFGFIFLSIGTYQFFVIGIFFFILFRIMDDVDGEVARAQNKQSLEGIYFEGMQDYIYFCCLGMGLGIGLFRLYHSEVYLYLGFLLTFVFIVDKAIVFLLQDTSRKGVIDKKINKTISDKDIQKKLQEKISEGRSWADKNIFLKLFGMYPSGLVYSFEFIGPILVVLTLIEYLLSIYINFPLAIYGQTFGILSVYLFIFSVVKLIRIISFISKLEKNRYITNLLNELQ